MFKVFFKKIPVFVKEYNAQVQVWLAPLPIHACVGAIANRGQYEQGCNLYMATDLGRVRATRKKKTIIATKIWGLG